MIAQTAVTRALSQRTTGRPAILIDPRRFVQSASRGSDNARMRVPAIHADTAKVLFGSIGLVVLVVAILSGWSVADVLSYLPQWEPSRVADTLNARFARQPQMMLRDFECETGTQGWDFVCFAYRDSPPKTGTPATPLKFGVMNHPYYGPAQPIALPLDGPTPTIRELTQGSRRVR